MKTATKLTKQEHSAKLRKEWSEIKNSLTADQISEAEAICKAHGLNFSATGYAFCKEQMAQANLTGTALRRLQNLRWLEESRVSSFQRAKIFWLRNHLVKGRKENQRRIFYLPQTIRSLSRITS